MLLAKLQEESLQFSHKLLLESLDDVAPVLAAVDNTLLHREGPALNRPF